MGRWICVIFLGYQITHQNIQRSSGLSAGSSNRRNQQALDPNRRNKQALDHVAWLPNIRPAFLAAQGGALLQQECWMPWASIQQLFWMMPAACSRR